MKEKKVVFFSFCDSLLLVTAHEERTCFAVSSVGRLRSSWTPYVAFYQCKKHDCRL